jgi:hypothetical protein
MAKGRKSDFGGIFGRRGVWVRCCEAEQGEIPKVKFPEADEADMLRRLESNRIECATINVILILKCMDFIYRCYAVENEIGGV